MNAKFEIKRIILLIALSFALFFFSAIGSRFAVALVALLKYNELPFNLDDLIFGLKAAIAGGPSLGVGAWILIKIRAKK